MSHPGLDLNALRALRAARHDTSLLRTRVQAHLEAHDGYLAFSAGKDSLVVLDLARRVEPFVPVVFFDSGLEFPETYRYLDDLQQRWRLNLQVLPAQTPLIEILVTDGSWDHKAAEYPSPDIFDALIGQPSRSAHQAHGPGELWGVRAAESPGRRAAYATALSSTPCCSCCTTDLNRRSLHGGVIRRKDGTVAFGPIWDWTDDQVWAHIARHDLPLNPVYAKLRRLGADPRSLRISHLVDADHLEHGRICWLKRGWPDLYERLHQALPRIDEYL